MKKLLLLFLLFSSLYSFGQEVKDKTYRFVNPEVVNNLAAYEEAFSTADMTIFRYINKSNVIEFKSSLKVELFSANKLSEEGFDVDTNKVLSGEPVNRGHYVFDLSANGKYIMQLFTKTKLK